jgi:isopenicillin-N epimerase
MAFGRSLRSEWLLDPDLVYLNHPTVGATPRVVLAAQRAIQDDTERNPSRFQLRELTDHAVGKWRPAKPRLREAADVVAAFVGARGEDLVFVDNTTTGANAVLRSFPFEPGDEVLVSDLGYGGVTRAAIYETGLRGASVKTVSIPHPFDAEAIVDHIAADAGLLLPLVAIVARLKARGVAVLADGAHGPGAMALDVPSIGADWYVANLHKWAFVPRSSGFLWTSPERQATTHPAVMSWGLGEGYTSEFDLPGTRDASAHLAAPAAIAFFDRLGGRAAVYRYIHELAVSGAQMLAERWGTALNSPASMMGAMGTITLPASLGSTADDAAVLRDALLFEDHVEVGLSAARGRLHVRVAAAVYNDMDDYEQLAAAIERRM